MWNKAISGCFSPIATTINPSCLVVEYAIIFFISCCKNADVAANIAVSLPIMRQLFKNTVLGFTTEIIRISRNTPATTIVDLCSKADTGVGPSIAAGSHGCSPNWADFPMAATRHPAKIILISHFFFWSSLFIFHLFV